LAEKVKLTFEDFKKAAAELQSTCDSLSAYKAEMLKGYTLARANWHGLAGNAFEDSCQKLLNKLAGNIERLEKLINDLKQIQLIAANVDNKLAKELIYGESLSTKFPIADKNKSPQTATYISLKEVASGAFGRWRDSHTGEWFEKIEVSDPITETKTHKINIGQAIVVNNSHGNLPSDNRGAKAQPFKTNAGTRSPEAYSEVVESFNVENTTRYQKQVIVIKDNEDGIENSQNEKKTKTLTLTYCNIYAWDVTCAMSAEIPHYIDSAGAPSDAKEADTELSASATYDWLDKHGATYGWVAVTEQEAVARANAGFPTVAVSKKDGSGHIAIVVPQKEEDTDVMISQAGKNNYNHQSLNYGFGKDKEVLYYTHD